MKENEETGPSLIKHALSLPLSTVRWERPMEHSGAQNCAHSSPRIGHESRLLWLNSSLRGRAGAAQALRKHWEFLAGMSTAQRSDAAVSAERCPVALRQTHSSHGTAAKAWSRSTRATAVAAVQRRAGDGGVPFALCRTAMRVIKADLATSPSILDN